MKPQISIGVANQVLWPKAGDVDDCACLACMSAVLAVAPWLPMPNIRKFREASGVPDHRGEPDGHSINEVARAMRKLWPALAKLTTVSAGDLTKERVLTEIEGGRPAMLFVWSGALPADQQYGFSGGHAIAAVYVDGEFLIANPLAPAHSRWKTIGRNRLGEALRAMPGPGARAILMPTVEQAFTTHPLYLAPGTPDPVELDAAEARGFEAAKALAGQVATQAIAGITREV